MTIRQCAGLHPLARSAYAWLAPQGSWIKTCNLELTELLGRMAELADFGTSG